MYYLGAGVTSDKFRVAVANVVALHLLPIFMARLFLTLMRAKRLCGVGEIACPMVHCMQGPPIVTAEFSPQSIN